MTTITIDGQRGTGKSTLGAGLRLARGYSVLDVGALFRFTCWRSLVDGQGVDGRKALALLTSDHLRLTDQSSRYSAITLYWYGEEIGEALWQEVPSAELAKVSASPEVQAAITVFVRLKALASADGLVLIGRNTGSEIWPAADLKIELIADEEVRHARKAAELGIRGEWRAVDASDPDPRFVKVTSGELVIDTTHLTPDEVLAASIDAIASMEGHRRPRPSELDEWQDLLAVWQRINFPDTDSYQLVAGLIGEVGELAQALLKVDRNLVDPRVGEVLITDAIGDVFVYLLGVSSTRSVRVAEVFRTTIRKVLSRRWDREAS